MVSRPQFAPPVDEHDLEPVPQGEARVLAEERVGAQAVAAFEPVLAHQVVVRRNVATIMQELRALAAMSGERYFYQWSVKDRQNKRDTLVEGPTIKLANDLIRVYGNCAVDVRAFEEKDHTLFYARFADYEKGTSMVRAFRQRKGQWTGMRDRGRREDMTFQIGQSKAIRNVVCNILSTFSDFAMDEAKKNLLGYVENNRDKADEYITRVMQTYGIAVSRIEAIIGRKRKDWLLPDVARVLMELRGVEEGMVDPEENFPSAEDAETVTAEKAAAKEEGKDRPAEDPKAAAPAKPKQTKAETKPKEAADKPQETAPAAETEPKPDDKPTAPAEPAEDELDGLFDE